jgi:hypothetical protein
LERGTVLALVLTILGTFYLGVLPNRLLEAMERGVTERVTAQVETPLKAK